ncbi:MAG: twin-arginine translocase subunit TatC [Firmicutes bacterium]|nr:twin-arginine translocase subunit TatC [Bacillota bacterium]
MTDQEMTFLEHLDELRKRLIWSLIALLVGVSISYAFFNPIMEFIKWPLPADLKSVHLTIFGFMQIFTFRFKLSVIGGFILTSPFIIYQIIAFFAPALKEKERKYAYTLLPLLILLFLGGAAFAFFLVLPPSMEWLRAQGGGQLDFVNKADDYLNFVSLFVLAFGVAFETPLVIIFLIKLGIVDRKKLRKNWRYAYVVSFIIAAIATPDWSIVSMGLLGIALVLLFEISLFFARWL